MILFLTEKEGRKPEKDRGKLLNGQHGPRGPPARAHRGGISRAGSNKKLGLLTSILLAYEVNFKYR